MMTIDLMLMGGLGIALIVEWWWRVVLQWRWRSAILRLVTMFLLLLLLFFTEVFPRRSARRVLDLPPTERVTMWQGEPITSYQSGIRTTYRLFRGEVLGNRRFRVIVYGYLFWLACYPALPRQGRWRKRRYAAPSSSSPHRA